MNPEHLKLVNSVRYFSPYGLPRESLHSLPLIQEALERWPKILRVVSDALVDARVATSYDEALWLVKCWNEVEFPEGETGRAIMIGFDGGQEIGAIRVDFSDWQLASIDVDHTEHFFCPLSDKFQQINLLLVGRLRLLRSIPPTRLEYRTFAVRAVR